MILIIDIGNTNVVLGIYKQDKKINSWRLETRQTKTMDEYGSQIESILLHEGISVNDIEDVIIGSVVPTLQHTFKLMFKKYLSHEPIVIGENTRTGMPIKYENPKEVGADRIANSVAMIEHYELPAILIDMGTAITFDVVSSKGEYLGGAIAPGMNIASNALFEKTSKLPKVEFDIPKSSIGKTTEEAIKSGLVYGYVGLVDNIIEQILKDLGVTKEDTSIIGTGGYSNLISQMSKYITDIDKDITLEGMRLIYEKTKRKA
ncbi:type III pantothenate kinase [Helcococcus ovis]|uniref:type III pantothenate kinase n=1 Tax=Helcococcus ovis TaxID=72026 RepID=UPI0038B88AF2